MPFRLFGDEKVYKSHTEARKAAIEAGQSGYVWFGAKDINQTWIPVINEQTEPMPQGLSIVEQLRKIELVAYMVERDGVSSNIPVKSVCQSAADEIERLLGIISKLD